jgi:hypothetical protein
MTLACKADDTSSLPAALQKMSRSLPPAAPHFSHIFRLRAPNAFLSRAHGLKTPVFTAYEISGLVKLF